MDEYSWPTVTEVPAELLRRRWAAAVAALPLEASVTGEVIGHAERNHQVKIKLDEWDRPE